MAPAFKKILDPPLGHDCPFAYGIYNNDSKVLQKKIAFGVPGFSEIWGGTPESVKETCGFITADSTNKQTCTQNTITLS